MWKYVTRRIRDTFERSANHFDRRSATVVNNASGNFGDEKNKQPCCNWYSPRKCWNSYRYQRDNGTNTKKSCFEHLNQSWMDAITWSGGLVLGWYTSQLIHLKIKYHLRTNEKTSLLSKNFCTTIQPYIAYGKSANFIVNCAPEITRVVSDFTSNVNLVSNEHNTSSTEKSSHSGSSTTEDRSDDDLGEVLNSIENKLGLAAIENGQYQDGLSLLRSAANRNHAPAMYNLGLCYENGLGVSANEKIAMEFYKSAAALKHPGALYNLGVFYGQGRAGLKIDEVTATRLLKLAAVQGQQDAIDALKALDITIAELPCNDSNWNYQPLPFHQNDDYVPTHTRLYVENINYLQTRCEATF